MDILGCTQLMGFTLDMLTTWRTYSYLEQVQSKWGMGNLQVTYYNLIVILSS